MKRFLVLVSISLILFSCARRQVSESGALLSGGEEQHIADYAGSSLAVPGRIPAEKGIKGTRYGLSEPVTSSAPEEVIYQPYLFELDTTEETEDTTEVPPPIQPLVLAGAGATGAAVLSGIVVLLGPVGLFFVPLGLLVIGVWLTTMGLKRIKLDPEAWRGEKLANLVYYSLIPIGLFLMLLPVWLLFEL